MSKRNLLLCFDAFGTLFTPREPVHVQYAKVAQSLGLGCFNEVKVKSSFKEALKNEASRNPNFGKANGMNAEQWWRNIIQNTFQPLLSPGQQLPKELVPKLLYRFWSEEAYTLTPDVQLLLHMLRYECRPQWGGKLVVGVVTNSDDRVPDILSSLGLKVGPVRYGDELEEARDAESAYDTEFVVMSYDVGHEKPDRRIFEAAEGMVEHLHNAGSGESWQKIYVGDEYAKDAAGAVQAGWNSVLIGPHSEVSQHEDVTWLDERPVGNILEQLSSTPSVGFSRLGMLAKWLPIKPAP